MQPDNLYCDLAQASSEPNSSSNLARFYGQELAASRSDTSEAFVYFDYQKPGDTTTGVQEGVVQLQTNLPQFPISSQENER